MDMISMSELACRLAELACQARLLDLETVAFDLEALCLVVVDEVKRAREKIGEEGTGEGEEGGEYTVASSSLTH